MKYVSCDLCGQNDYDVLLPKSKALDGPLVRCHHCGLVYVNPRRTNFSVQEETLNPSDVRAAVSNQYKRIWNASLVSGASEIKHIRANFGFRLERMRRHVSSGNLLDIGCGKGHFLAVARDMGFSPVVGVEPNSQTAANARQEYGLEIVPLLDRSIFPEDNFDVVTMLHVIEHLFSPKQELETVRRILRPGGFLFIETPTIDTIWFRLLRGHWREFIPDHYFFFTPTTIRRLLTVHGFDILDISTIGKRMSVRFLFSRLWRYSKRLASSLIWLAEKTRLDDRELYLDLGDVMLVTAKKVARVDNR